MGTIPRAAGRIGFGKTSEVVPGSFCAELESL